MKYVVGFLRFWRSFILGDDSRVAITVMWAMIGAYAVDQTYLPSWYIVPIVVLALFIVLFVQATSPLFTIKLSYRNLSLYGLAAPLIAVTVLPVVVFRMLSQDFQVEHLLLPAVIISAVAVVISFLLGIGFRKFPALMSFVAGSIAFCYITFFKSTTIAASTWLVMHVPDIAAYIGLGLVIVFTVWLLGRSRYTTLLSS